MDIRQKLPGTSGLTRRGGKGEALRIQSGAPDAVVSAVIKTTKPDYVPNNLIRVRDRIGNTLTADLLESAVETVKSDSGVVAIEVAEKLRNSRPL